MLRVCHLHLLLPGMCAMRVGSRWANQAPKELSVNSCPTAWGKKLSQNNFGLLLTKSNWLNPKWLHPCRALIASEEQLQLYQLGSSTDPLPGGSSQPDHDCSITGCCSQHSTSSEAKREFAEAGSSLCFFWPALVLRAEHFYFIEVCTK